MSSGMSLEDEFLADLEDIMVGGDSKSIEIPVFHSVVVDKVQTLLGSTSRTESALLPRLAELASAADLEIAQLRRGVELVYSKSFPALGQLIPNHVRYLEAVSAILDHDGTTVSPALHTVLEKILPKSELVALAVSFSARPSLKLPVAEARKLKADLGVFQQIKNAQSACIEFCISCAKSTAPNTTKLLGAEVAGRLIGAAGGISKLACIPAGHIAAIGSSNGGREGIIFQADIVKHAGEGLRVKAARMLVNKTSLAARADAFGKASLSQPAEEESIVSSTAGSHFLNQIESALQRASDPRPLREVKALPVPEARPSKKRGGRRARAMKLKFGLSEFGKALSRTKFGTDAEEDINLEDMGEGMGMVGVETGGRLRGPERKRFKKG